MRAGTRTFCSSTLPGARSHSHVIGSASLRLAGVADIFKPPVGVGKPRGAWSAARPVGDDAGVAAAGGDAVADGAGEFAEGEAGDAEVVACGVGDVVHDDLDRHVVLQHAGLRADEVA